MARYKNKKPINILSKETREKYLSMTFQGLLIEEKNLKEKKSELEYETRYEVWITRSIFENRKDLFKKEEEVREIKRIQKAMPEIKRRVKNKEKSAKLGAYEGTSRIQGGGIIKKIKEQTSYPFNCSYCMNLTDSGSDHVDHVNPISNGGLSVENNMVLVCSKCNLKKRDLSLRSFCKSNNLDFNEVCERLEKMGKWI